MLVRLKSICILELQINNGNMYRTDRWLVCDDYVVMLISIVISVAIRPSVVAEILLPQ